MHPHLRLPKHTELQSDNTLHVIAVISNPARFRVRYGLFEEFRKRMLQEQHVNLITVELQYGDRHFEVTNEGDPNHVRLRTNSPELWVKESLINIGERHLPRNWKYIAWIDTDVQFTRADWAQETLHQLQSYSVVQLFETAVDMGPDNNASQIHYSFGALHAKGQPKAYVTKAQSGYYGATAEKKFAHPGFAWAARRTWWENVHGLMDFCIAGAADHHMALALIGDTSFSVPVGLHDNYYKRVYDWQQKAVRATNYNVGYVPGSILHYWHGPKKRRFYVERWSILKDSNYDPDSDIYKDGQGLVCLGTHKPKLRDDLRLYFKSRNEDSVDED